MGKVKGNKPQTAPRRKPKRELSEEELQKQKIRQGKVAAHSTIVVTFTTVVLILLFVGRWVYAITDGYFGSFILREWWEVDDAMANAFGLDLVQDEKDTLYPDLNDWDTFRSSRLTDEATITASLDGISLHGYYYDQGSDTTVIVLHQFDYDGTSDFIAGGWLGGEEGYNIVLPDARLHGESEGTYFSWGYQEQYDLADWIAWADEMWPEGEYIIWGNGFGANTALFAESNSLLPDDRIKGIVAESCYASFNELARHHIYKWYTIPAFPAIQTIELKLSLSKAGFKADDMELAPVMSGGNASVPVLFLQSINDTYILSDWSVEAYELYEGKKTALTGTGKHGTIYTELKNEIQSVIRSW